MKKAALLNLWRVLGPDDRKVDNGYPLQLVEKIANVFAVGSCYYYVFNFFDLEIDFVHPNVQQVLGVAPHDFSIEKYLDSIHPEDIELTHLKERVALGFLNENVPLEQLPYYKVSYINRLKTQQGYQTILHQAIPLAVTEDRKIGYMLNIQTDITYLDVPIDHKVSIIGLNGGTSWYAIDPENPDLSKVNLSILFSNRERQVLALLSQGRRSEEIAHHLQISVATVRTHRKNILAKTSCKNTTELVAKCIKNSLI